MENQIQAKINEIQSQELSIIKDVLLMMNERIEGIQPHQESQSLTLADDCCDPIYNDDQLTIASDVIRLVEKATGENVNYKEFDNSHFNYIIDGNIFKNNLNGNKVYRKTSFVVNNTIFLDDILGFGNDDAGKFEYAIQHLKELNGGKILFSKPLKFNRKVLINIVNGITIEALQSPSSFPGDSTDPFTSGSIEFINPDSLGLVINGFVDLTLKNLRFLFKSTSNSNDYLLELSSGHDFEIDNLKFRNFSPNGNCLRLGRDTGELCVFQGNISRVSTQQNGGVGIYTGMTNTSLNFRACYIIGGCWHIKGTVYSTFISCACDVSKTHGYIIEGVFGEGTSPAHSLTFISCGAEKTQKSGFWIGSDAYNITLISPHSGLNNQGNYDNIGEFLTMDNNGNHQDAIKITNPVIFKNSNEKPDIIFGTNERCGLLILDSIYPSSFGKINGNSYWINNKIIKIGYDSSFLKLSSKILNQYGNISSYSRRFASETKNLNSTETYFYLQSEGVNIKKDSKLICISLWVNENIISETGTSGTLAFGDGVNVKNDIIIDIPLSIGTKVSHVFRNNEYVDYDFLGLRFHLNDNSTMTGGTISVELFFENLY